VDDFHIDIIAPAVGRVFDMGYLCLLSQADEFTGEPVCVVSIQAEGGLEYPRFMAAFRMIRVQAEVAQLVWIDDGLIGIR
jgi:hypothetical protein